MSYDILTEQQRQWIADYCNQTISPEEFSRFETAMTESPELRAATRQYLALDANLRQGSESLADIEAAWNPKATSKVVAFPRWIGLAAAAVIAFTVGLVFNFVLHGEKEQVADRIEKTEATASGYAVVHGLFDAALEGDAVLRAGDVLGGDTIALASGSARIDFFSGAQIYIEGPAKLSIKSAWEAEFLSGKLRAKVPPAARGFAIVSNGRRIVDLGTEFGIDTNSSEVKVEVFTGKIEIENRQFVEGEAVSLTRDGRKTPIDSRIDLFSNLRSLTSGSNNAHLLEFNRWKNYSDTLSRDSRLIAYYPFLEKPKFTSDLVPSGMYPENRELDGAVIMADWVDSRWGELKGAMEFRRPGSRVRVHIPGEFKAFTFSCWARIDSLDRWYNALFLADSYQTGEPHWQIRNDGVLMLGVMVDDSRMRENAKFESDRISRNYYSPPIWDMSMSGQWMHLVSVYDPASRTVKHYVDGKMISDEKILDELYIDTLRIGNAEIGNWSQPIRKDPEFAIRNLNGRIDELAIFNAALGAEEVANLFQRGQRK